MAMKRGSESQASSEMTVDRRIRDKERIKEIIIKENIKSMRKLKNNLDSMKVLSNDTNIQSLKNFLLKKSQQAVKDLP